MKKRQKLIIPIVFLVTLVACSKQVIEQPEANNPTTATQIKGSDATYYYWYKGEKIPLTLNTNYINIIADDNTLKSSSTSSLFREYNMTQDNSNQIGYLTKFRLNSKLAISEYSKITDNLKRTQQIKHVLPFFERGNAEPIGTSDIFYLKLKQTEDITKLTELADDQNIQIVKEVPNMPLWYILSIQNSTFNNSIDASNYFYETGYFEEIDPAFMFNYQPCTNDPLFDQLWGLKNTSYPNIDINVENAWTITKGAGATVAVIDQGIDPNHNDLKANFHSLNFDAQSGIIGSVFEDQKHGTHVAGTIAAVGNNNLQVVGVAYESKIMRVSHRLEISPTASAELASGISWAWQNGADVINNSWGDQGGTYYNQLHSAILEQAITNAMTGGRNGLGCVVIFAAGNTSSVIDYPANYHDAILTVGSISENGNRSSTSGYGPKLDIMAPGSNILSTIPGNRTDFLSGTSMAAPHITGVAALIISKTPSLTREQVTDAIESTAQKVGTYNYTTIRNNGTWCEQMGYGLVNAFEAVDASRFIINGDNEIWAGKIANYSLPDDFSQYQNSAIWSCSSNDVHSSYYSFDPQTAELSIVSHEGGMRSEGTFTITAEIPYINRRRTKTVKCLKSYIDGTISVQGIGRVPFFTISNGDISGMLLYMPARTTADINIEYPDHGSYTYFTSRINNFYNATFWGEGKYYHASMGEAGSYVNADIIYNNPPYPQMEYNFRIHSSDSPVVFSITDKYIIIPQQNIGKNVSKIISSTDHSPSDWRYEISSNSNTEKISGLINIVTEEATKIDISDLHATNYTFTIYQGNEVISCIPLEKQINRIEQQ